MLFGLEDRVLNEIKKIAANNKNIKEIKIFGSRALGNFRPNSDIDLVVFGLVDFETILKIRSEFNELSTPYKFDVVDYNTIENLDLKKHIDQYAQNIYLKNESSSFQKSRYPMNSVELFEILQHIKVGGTVCHYSLKKCEEFVPLINEINELKIQKNAVILAHSYVSPEIVYGVADFVGDSYQLSKDAISSPAKIIVFAAVRFMGETAQILNPKKEVLIPAPLDGCTLADAINAAQVRALREEFPGYTFVCYINTTAEVKAECDVCVTSSNVYDIVERIPNDRIYFLPDKFMGMNLIEEMKLRGVKKDIRYFHGTCYVHEEYGVEQIHQIRLEYPEAKIVSHPECKPEIIKESDYVGSTSQMLQYMQKTDAKEFLMLTECGLSSRLQVEMPQKRLVGSCTLCRYMKSNTLKDILRVLKNPVPRDRVIISEDTRLRALRCVEAMFKYAGK